MHQFDRYVDVISESVSNLTHGELDPTVFHILEGRPPILQPMIKVQIIDVIKRLGQLIPIRNFYIVGHILSSDYHPETTIEVHIEVNPTGVDNIYINSALITAKKVSGDLANGTQHPIHYHLITKAIDVNAASAVYDVASERWIKEPTIKDGRVESFVRHVHRVIGDAAYMEFKGELFPKEELKTFSREQIVQIKDTLHNTAKVADEGQRRLYDRLLDQLQEIAETYDITPTNLKSLDKFSNRFWRQR